MPLILCSLGVVLCDGFHTLLILSRVCSWNESVRFIVLKYICKLIDSDGSFFLIPVTIHCVPMQLFCPFQTVDEAEKSLAEVFGLTLLLMTAW
jgi:hypothetical protein